MKPGEPRKRIHSGFTLLEVIVAMCVAAILGSTTLIALLSAQKYATSTRVLNNARIIVQRNIHTALGVKFTDVDVPGILQLTDSGGVTYNDQGGGSSPTVPIIVSSASNTVVSGTLTRIVTAHPNSANAVIRRVTFRLDYELQGRSISYSMSTIRAQDNQ